MGGGKPRGIRAGRKLKTHRRLNRYFSLSSNRVSLTIDGPITTSTRQIRSPSGESPSRVLLTLPVSSSRRSLLRPSSPTLPSESVSEFNSRRTTKESPASFLRTVACHSSMRTTRYSLPVSVVQAMPSVICQESDSELSKSQVSLSTPSGSKRRKSPLSEIAARLPHQLLLLGSGEGAVGNNIR